MPSEPRTIAALDMGTNTFKLSVFRIVGTTIEEVASDNRVMRIARLIDGSGTLPASGVDTIIDAVAELADIAHDYASESYIGVATQGFRTASNGDAVIARIHAETPWNLRLISGDEEAALTFEGLVDHLPQAGSAVIVDIGGGSTELVYAVDRRVQRSESHPVGSGVLTDRYVRNNPPAAAELDEATIEADARIGESAIPGNASIGLMLLAGGAGQFLDDIARLELSGPLDSDTLGKLEQVMLHTTAEALAAMLGIPVIRAQVLPAGHRIAASAYRAFQPASVRSVPSGIRRGLVRRWLAHHPST